MSTAVMRCVVVTLVLFCPTSGFAFPVSPLSLLSTSHGTSMQSCGWRESLALRAAGGDLRMDVGEFEPQKVPVVAERRQSNMKLTEHSIAVIGLSHKTAPVEVRERLSAKEEEWNTLAGQLCDLPSVQEAAVLSTCNRFELYLVSNDNRRAVREVTELLSARSGVPLRELREHLFMLDEYDGVWHVMKVAGGLDSLVVGEGQILSQMKRCYEVSMETTGKAGKVLQRMLNAAVSAGKRVRTETAISRGGVSISSAAVELAEAKAEQTTGMALSECSVSIIGAGKMARLLVQHLIPRGVSPVLVFNRNPERAEALKAEFEEGKVEIR
eukprot:CAMPEP_0177716374 /NCGR_PEP_ID=MMETSP0484_2-20121128/14479_1 /TAXON_ID=354590 /ORGANISM="Rhodomonas lens, Strain RHODO" /LENGTH=325 /DNA_ID=CAMNT_0019228407 /DNA_START=73 /DNA_END=1047 /DNA_ORIENTATION=-